MTCNMRALEMDEHAPNPVFMPSDITDDIHDCPLIVLRDAIGSKGRTGR
jgi:hypothetical protein